jgi:hypothetical protein
MAWLIVAMFLVLVSRFDCADARVAQPASAAGSIG